MSAFAAKYGSLPFINPGPTPSERSVAETLISAERALLPDDPHHARLPPPHTPTYTSLMASEMLRIAAVHEASHPNAPPPASLKLSALDLDRYDTLSDPPALAELAALPTHQARQQLLQDQISRSAILLAYISARDAHLALLGSKVGRNAWLIGNWQLEGSVMRPVERELKELDETWNELAARRRAAQEEFEGKLKGLEEAWKRGVVRIVETEAATVRLRREVLELRRQLS